MDDEEVNLTESEEKKREKMELNDVPNRSRKEVRLDWVVVVVVVV